MLRWGISTKIKFWRGMNKQDIGALSKMMVISSLMKSGRKVLDTIGENHRFDISFYTDSDKSIKTVQCKTAHLVNGVISVPMRNVKRKQVSNGNGTCSIKYTNSTYVGEVDYIGVYCPENDKCYLVSTIGNVKTQTNLRIDTPKKKFGTSDTSMNRIRWAEDFEV